MKHFHKITIYLVALTMNFVFIQTDLMSQNDSLALKDRLVIGKTYKVKLINDEIAVGKLQTFDSTFIRLLIDENIIRIRRAKIKTMKLSKHDYSAELYRDNSQSKFPCMPMSLTGGGSFPFGNFSHGHDNGWNSGIEMSINLSPQWAIFLNGTYNSFGYHDTIFSDISASNTELMTGVRLYLVKENVKMFGEAGIGLNVNSANESNSTKSNSYFGMIYGIGTEIKLIDEVEIVFRMNYNIFWVPKDVWFIGTWTTYSTREYIGFKLGLKYNFR